MFKGLADMKYHTCVSRCQYSCTCNNNNICMVNYLHRLELLGGNSWWTRSDCSNTAQVREDCTATGMVMSACS